MKFIADVSDLRGRYVLLRASLNVPIANGEVGDLFRLKQALPTLKFLQAQGARTIVVGHIGRDVTDTLRPVYEALSREITVAWGGLVTDPAFRVKRDAMEDGEVLLAENLRQDQGEKANDPEFAKLLASYADVYVNDAFGNIHREHASMVGVPALLPAYAGMNVRLEIEQLQKVMQPESPSLFLLGGAKFETKLPLIEKYLAIYDHIFIGGALGNDVLRALGYPVGTSLLSDTPVREDIARHPKILVPVDVEVQGPQGRRVCEPENVAADETILDAGPATVAMLKPYIAEAKTIVWNGPFGNFEHGFAEATEATAKLVAQSEAFSVLGGGDTVAATEKLGLHDQFGFVSTGGGAMLTYLEKGTTPALEALK